MSSPSRRVPSLVAVEGRGRASKRAPVQNRSARRDRGRTARGTPGRGERMDHFEGAGPDVTQHALSAPHPRRLTGRLSAPAQDRSSTINRRS